jgi:hypothetical protein
LRVQFGGLARGACRQVEAALGDVGGGEGFPGGGIVAIEIDRMARGRRLEMMPSLMVRSSPLGVPTAYTRWPTFNSLAGAMRSAGARRPSTASRHRSRSGSAWVSTAS